MSTKRKAEHQGPPPEPASILTNKTNSTKRQRRLLNRQAARRGLLSLLWGPHLLTLGEFLDRAHFTGLHQPHDSPAYRSLLTQCIVRVTAEHVAALQNMTRGVVHVDTFQLLMELPERELRYSADPRCVLAFGSKRLTSDQVGVGQSKSGSGSTRVEHPNSTLHFIRTQESFDCLHHRIGSDPLLTLLSKVQLFYPLRARAYVQIGGPSAADMILPRIRTPLPTPTVPLHPLRPPKPPTAPTAATPPPGILTQAAPPSHARKPRLSSWRRRKQKKQQLQDTAKAPAKSPPAASAADSAAPSAKNRPAKTPKPNCITVNTLLYRERTTKAKPEGATAEQVTDQLLEGVPASVQATAKEPLSQLVSHALRRLSRVPVGRLLDRLCPLSLELLPLLSTQPPSASGTANPRTSQQTGGAAEPAYISLLRQYSPTWQVVRFACVLLKAVLPAGLLCSRHNLKRMWAAVRMLLSRRKFEGVRESALRFRLQLAQLKWLRLPAQPQPAEQRAQQLVASRLMRWLLVDVLVPRLARAFYITETSMNGKRLFFYRRSVWNALARSSFQQLLDRQQFVEDPPTKAPVVHEMTRSGSDIDSVKDTAAMQAARLRLLPKPTKVRPIINLGKKGHMGRRRQRVLQPLFDVLTQLRAQSRTRHLFGASILSLDEAHARLLPLLMRVRQLPADQRALYVVSVDAQNCFDTIRQQRLRAVMNDVLPGQDHNLYTFTRCAVITRNGVRPNKRYPNAVQMPLKGAPGFLEMARSLSAGSRLPPGGLLVNLVTQQHHTRAELQEGLESLLRDTRVVYAGRRYRLHEGVPQGSVISSLLTSLHYGHLERTHLQRFLSPVHSATFFRAPPQGATQGPSPAANADEQQAVLVRATDDFLLVSLQREPAELWLERMTKGFPEYGLTINAAKSQLSFSSAHVPGVQPRTEIRWDGICLDTERLEVRCDWTRLCGFPSRDSMYVSPFGLSGAGFISKLIQMVKGRLPSVVLDERISGADTVRQNLYCALLFAAIRFHQLAAELPGKNPRFQAAVIQRVLEFTRSRVARWRRNRQHCQCSISAMEVRALGLVAFHRVLRARPAQHGELLQHLSYLLRAPAVQKVTRQLRDIVNNESIRRMFLARKNCTDANVLQY